MLPQEFEWDICYALGERVQRCRLGIQTLSLTEGSGFTLIVTTAALYYPLVGTVLTVIVIALYVV